MPAEKITLFISLYLDEDVYRDLAAMLRAKDFDAISAHELGQTGVSGMMRGTWPMPPGMGEPF